MEKYFSPFDIMAADTKKKSECPFFKKAAAKYKKHSPPFDRGVADTQANLECPFHKEAADRYQKNIYPPLI